MYINKAMIYGNLTKDPEIKALPNGTAVVGFSVATNRTWKDKNGQKQEVADYHNVVAFGKTAELIHQYMKKGSALYIEGRLQTRSWEGPDGKKNYKTEIVVDQMQFGPRREGAARVEGSQEAPAGATAQAETGEAINVDDIPF